jgi:hypothetical protein
MDGVDWAGVGEAGMPATLREMPGGAVDARGGLSTATLRTRKTASG